ncbi:MAG TPA: hypothetical protein VL728_15210 [Cyclobacteriaceae bacterium]|jgi:hypothetical protein|nr:hypothetical protein [Cyclobacteriaceae bacterium]
MKWEKCVGLSLLVLAAISCSKTEIKKVQTTTTPTTPTTPPPTTPTATSARCLPLQTNQLNANGTTFASESYVYDNDVLISYSRSGSLYVGTYTYTITRNSSGLITKVIGQEPSLTQTLYTYDDSDRLTSQLFYVTGLANSRYYFYNSFGQLSRVTFGQPDTTALSGTYIYSYANNNTKNPSTIGYYENNKLSTTVTMTFDTLKSTNSICFPGLPDGYGTFSSNNVLSYVQAFGVGNSYADIYTYTYNADGFPISGTRINKQVDNGKTYSDTIPLTYSYSNCK